MITNRAHFTAWTHQLSRRHQPNQRQLFTYIPYPNTFSYYPSILFLHHPHIGNPPYCGGPCRIDSVVGIRFSKRTAHCLAHHSCYTRASPRNTIAQLSHVSNVVSSYGTSYFSYAGITAACIPALDTKLPLSPRCLRLVVLSHMHDSLALTLPF